MSVLPILERTPALSGIEPQILQRMAATATMRTVRRGEYLWHAADLPKAFTVLRFGLVKIVRTTARGRSAICALFGPPSSIGDLAMLRGTPYGTDAIVATESVTIVSIPREVFLRATEESNKLGVSIACAFYGQLSALQDKIDVLSAGAVDARLATLLLKLYEQFGDDFDDGTSRIPVALSRRELADLVATSFETAIRVMTRWERQGVVATDADGFTVRNLAQLRAAVCGCAENDPQSESRQRPAVSRGGAGTPSNPPLAGSL